LRVPFPSQFLHFCFFCPVFCRTEPSKVDRRSFFLFSLIEFDGAGEAFLKGNSIIGQATRHPMSFCEDILVCPKNINEGIEPPRSKIVSTWIWETRLSPQSLLYWWNWHGIHREMSRGVRRTETKSEFDVQRRLIGEWINGNDEGLFLLCHSPIKHRRYIDLISACSTQVNDIKISDSSVRKSRNDEIFYAYRSSFLNFGIFQLMSKFSQLIFHRDPLGRTYNAEHCREKDQEKGKPIAWEFPPRWSPSRDLLPKILSLRTLSKFSFAFGIALVILALVFMSIHNQPGIVASNIATFLRG